MCGVVFFQFGGGFCLVLLLKLHGLTSAVLFFFQKKLLDAKAKELQEQSRAVRAEMESFLDKC